MDLFWESAKLQKTGLPKSTVHWLLRILEQEGLCVKTQNSSSIAWVSDFSSGHGSEKCHKFGLCFATGNGEDCAI